jgi:DNA mismatch repair ATPase MutS
VLYLLDEILHGTNTAERRIAARGVVRHLLASGAIGAVSTHDLTLADAPDLASAAHSVHFREEVRAADGERPGALLTFDYRLRGGVATTRNALKLLEAVGLGGLELEG